MASVEQAAAAPKVRKSSAAGATGGKPGRAGQDLFVLPLSSIHCARVVMWKRHFSGLITTQEIVQQAVGLARAACCCRAAATLMPLAVADLSMPLAPPPLVQPPTWVYASFLVPGTRLPTCRAAATTRSCCARFAARRWSGPPCG